MQKEEIKFADSLVFEGMTSVRAIISGIDAGVNDRSIKDILFDKSKLNKISKEIGYLRAVSQKYGFKLVPTDSQSLSEITLGNSHGGIVAISGERTIPRLTKEHISVGGFYAMIQGIEDPYNFGYALRSLYACGCDGIILGERNWLTASGVVCRSSAGASEMFRVFRAEEEECVDLFKECGFKVVCADERTDNVLGEVSLPCPILLVVGGEKRGISRAVIDKADLLVKIMYARDFRASLSAASATTMFAYEIMRQRNK